MSNLKYINDDGKVSFNGYMGKSPMDTDAVVSALNALNILCEGYEAKISSLADANTKVHDALRLLRHATEHAMDDSLVLFVNGGTELNSDDIISIVDKALGEQI
jgi:hypothetical protein